MGARLPKFRADLFVWLWVTILVVCSMVSPVSADPVESVFLEGVQAYEKGQFQEAVTAFQTAFAQRKNPSLAYNIAMSFERLDSPMAAVEWWRKYSAFNPADRAAIEQRIGTLLGASLSNSLSDDLEQGPANVEVGLKPITFGVGVIGVVTSTVLGSMAMYYANKSTELSSDRGKEKYARQARGYALTTDVTLVVSLISLAYGGTNWFD